ncbi:MAG: hypothetical protein H6765_08975 [Candidatus Peribacteria bacterium]|nr:MAG: hypothetical protein H6765_08975 [Candidatus Peribacteria bacterium]
MLTIGFVYLSTSAVLAFTSEQQTRIDAAAVALVQVLQRNGLSFIEFVDVLGNYRDRYVDDTARLLLADTLEESTA